jgi:gamma-glutamylcyclotransferase (GGCT)/AIG2-like uncharacterized protein YtfP
MEKIFSYGTLQYPKVQLSSFGRLLKGEKTKLVGFKLEQVKINDFKVLELSNQEFHPMAIPSGSNEYYIEGMVFEITKNELAQSDKYEVEDYKRIKVQLENSCEAWVYVQA